MALVKCSECNKEISDKAKACVHCGNPIKKEIAIDKEIVKNSNKETVTNLSDALSGSPKIWFYKVGEEKNGPISVEQVKKLTEENIINQETLMWKNDMYHWLKLKEITTLEEVPPIPKSEVSSVFVWLLAFMPIIGAVLEYAITNAIGVVSGSLWFIAILLNIFAYVLDLRAIKKSGYDISGYFWWIILVPVYLFKRAKLLEQKNTYAFVWCIAFVILLLY